MDVDPCEFYEEKYVMWLLDKNRILFKFPGILREMISWENDEYEGARRHRNIHDAAMESHWSFGRQQLSSKEDPGMRYFLLKFDKDLDNEAFRPANQECHTELEKSEVQYEMTKFVYVKQANLPCGRQFEEEKRITRIAWVIAFAAPSDNRFLRPRVVRSSALRNGSEWGDFDDFNGSSNGSVHH